MASSNTVTGARLKMAIIQAGKSRYVGLFQSFSYGLNYTAEPIYTLGNHAPVEIIYTSQDAVQISATGWRVVEHGPHQDMAVPHLQDLLLHEYIELMIEDRQSKEKGKPDQIARVAKFRNCRPIGYSTSVNARGAEEVTVNFLCTRVDDESGDNHESATAPSFP